MKLEPKQNLNIGAKRTLKMLKDVFLRMVTRKSFDDIQIAELCEEAMISRATFYNYFEDKYDLMNWILEDFLEQLYPEMDIPQDHGPRVHSLIDQFYDVLDQNRETFYSIFRHNPKGSTLYQACYENILEGIQRMLASCTNSIRYKVPLELVDKMNAHAVLAVTEYAYVEKHEMTREEIHRCLDELLV